MHNIYISKGFHKVVNEQRCNEMIKTDVCMTFGLSVEWKEKKLQTSFSDSFDMGMFADTVRFETKCSWGAD